MSESTGIERCLERESLLRPLLVGGRGGSDDFELLGVVVLLDQRWALGGGWLVLDLSAELVSVKI